MRAECIHSISIPPNLLLVSELLLELIEWKINKIQWRACYRGIKAVPSLKSSENK